MVIILNIIRFICIAFGTGGLIVRLILRSIPDPKLNFLNKKVE